MANFIIELSNMIFIKIMISSKILYAVQAAKCIPINPMFTLFYIICISGAERVCFLLLKYYL
ncbi:protein of unknown function [Streptococcus thermophilus]|nr:protein of unknown function [Streptococcus thermophilus]